jgi:hypothetical protein
VRESHKRKFLGLPRTQGQGRLCWSTTSHHDSEVGSERILAFSGIDMMCVFKTDQT